MKTTDEIITEVRRLILKRLHSQPNILEFNDLTARIDALLLANQLTFEDVYRNWRVEKGVSKHIVITGNPVDGFDYHGPFDEHGDATEFAGRLGVDWWIAELTAPEVE